MADINGIAHIQLSVSDIVRSRDFYSPLLGAMGMIPVIDSDDYFYCVGGRTALAIAPGYYSTLFEDPDGIRVEINFVPGRGLLEE